jgi:AAA-like domain
MRRFSSYGPVNPKIHYYAPRKELISSAYTRLVGNDPNEGGHYITVWAPRQCGKTWIMLEVLKQLEQSQDFNVVHMGLEHLKNVPDISRIISSITKEISRQLSLNVSSVDTLEAFQEFFTSNVLMKPLILIIDEFDALCEEAINSIVSIFRNIYIQRLKEVRKPIKERWYKLHSLALIGVRSVLGIENESGSPFNVQQSLHIPNLTPEETIGLFLWYEKESGQHVDQEVIDRLFYETKGQPGLICWFGELLTDIYNEDKTKSITIDNFEEVYSASIKILPNNNILNIISKAKQDPYKQEVLDLFKTARKVEFSFDNKRQNYLYMNGVINYEKQGRTEYYVKFSCPLVQKRLFNYFANELFPNMGKLHEPFENLGDTIDEAKLNPRNLLKRYQIYFKKNRDWLLKNAPRRSDLRVYEAVYHFNLYSFLDDFLETWGAKVIPEFPTGNGKIDLTIIHGNNIYGLELKSYTNEPNYTKALEQAAKYGSQLKLKEVFLVFFVEYIDDATREKYEKDFKEKNTGIIVKPIFIETAN